MILLPGNEFSGCCVTTMSFGKASHLSSTGPPLRNNVGLEYSPGGRRRFIFIAAYFVTSSFTYTLSPHITPSIGAPSTEDTKAQGPPPSHDSLVLSHFNKCTLRKAGWRALRNVISSFYAQHRFETHGVRLTEARWCGPQSALCGASQTVDYTVKWVDAQREARL